MTKEITKAIILQEMQDKLHLREFAPASFLFEETVVPVYNIEPHIAQMTSEFKERSITSSGSVGFFDVPENERWMLNRYDVVFMGAGAFTVAGVYVIRKINRGGNVSGSSYNYLDLTAGQTVSYIKELPYPLVLVSGDELKINVDGYTSTQDLRLYIDYTVEVIR